MQFNDHSNLEGLHAFLSPSQPHWVNYDDEKLKKRYTTATAAARGDALHAFAEQAIKLREKLFDCEKTLNMYVNDAIGFAMTPEQPLFFSEYCFGTADAICFRKEFLRIHDLKTGVTPGKIVQLKVYAALFCLEYGVIPDNIEMELRIYQNNEILIETPESEEISKLMKVIIAHDKKLRKLETEG